MNKILGFILLFSSFGGRAETKAADSSSQYPLSIFFQVQTPEAASGYSDVFHGTNFIFESEADYLLLLKRLFKRPGRILTPLAYAQVQLFYRENEWSLYNDSQDHRSPKEISSQPIYLINRVIRI